ncbi:ATP-dependent zinc metalloprotease FTSH 5, partial [Durusdinium trenchii]
LERLEDDANMRAGDAVAQEKFLREVVKVAPQIAVQRVESGRFASSEGVFKEYLKALVATGKLEHTSMNQLLQSGAATAGAGAFANGAGMGQFGGAAAAQYPVQGYGGNAAFEQYYAGGGGSGSGGYNNGWASAGVAQGFGGYAGTQTGQQQLQQANSSEHNPVFVQMVDGGVKTQLWRTVRMLALGALMIAGFNMLMDGKGMPRGLGMTSEVKPVIEETGKSFKDVMGASEAKEELQEIVAYLQDPARFTRLGGKLPKGVLLTGPPGTGKTLLAKAIAGEAGTPFFYASGSEFEEMYVGVGARRVRDLFDAAKKSAPCIVFIDEIDAIGSTRALKEQQALKMTLNQLLVELDGFQETQGVIIVGATNFPDILDPALTRPGRFDRNVVVPLPDLRDRKAILDLYLEPKPTAEDVDVEVIARGTPGASGADIANLVNIAALRASTSGAEMITLADLEYAKDKILMGSERKSAFIPEEVRKVTAYHEGGHALVAIHTDGAMPIHKATIMPRGQALGMVHQLPEEQDMLQRSKRQMLAELDVCMGGRVAEELIFGADSVTSGASSDIQKATQIARGMVERYGMGDEAKLGVMYMPTGGRDKQPVSNETKQAVDDEVRRILGDSYARAKSLLSKHQKQLHRLAKALLENESLTSDQIRLVIQGKPIPAAVPPTKADKPTSVKASKTAAVFCAAFDADAGVHRRVLRHAARRASAHVNGLKAPHCRFAVPRVLRLAIVVNAEGLVWGASLGLGGRDPSLAVCFGRARRECPVALPRKVVLERFMRNERAARQVQQRSARQGLCFSTSICLQLAHVQLLALGEAVLRAGEAFQRNNADARPVRRHQRQAEAQPDRAASPHLPLRPPSPAARVPGPPRSAARAHSGLPGGCPLR